MKKRNTLPFGDVAGGQSPGLGADDADVLIVGGSVLKDVLRYLGRLAASSISRDDDDSTSLKFLQNLIAMLGDRELKDQNSIAI